VRLTRPTGAPPPDVAPVHEVRIAGAICPTLNALMRGKLRARMALEAGWRAVVAHAATAAGVPRATGKRRVTIRIILGARRRGADPDAFFKASGDALKAAGMLVDDSRKWVEWAPTEYEPGAQDGTVYVIEEVES
jgi:hypothetical protein